MAKKEVVKREENAIVVAKDYEEYAGRGFQNQTQEDIAIPFINVLQSNSPEVEEKTVEGAESGMLINSVTKDLYKSIQIVPAVTRHRFIEWIPRDSGGGLVGFHEVGSDVVKEAKARAKAEGAKFGKYTTVKGNDLVETFEVFAVLSIDDQAAGMAVVSFASMKIKPYKVIMGRLNSYQTVTEDGRRINPPLFAHLIEITTVFTKKPEGTFYNAVVKPAVGNDVEKSTLETNDPRFTMGAELEKLVMAGAADADYASQTAERGEGGDGDDDLPF